MDRGQRRFDVGMSLFVIGIVWNVYFSVRQLMDDSVTAYGGFLVLGGLVAALGLVLVVVEWRRSGGKPWR